MTCRTGDLYMWSGGVVCHGGRDRMRLGKSSKWTLVRLGFCLSRLSFYQSGWKAAYDL